MPEKIEAEELQLMGIFSNAYSFVIPDYQRPYVWTTEQTGELLDDILQAMDGVEDEVKVVDASPYFLGSIVIVKDGQSAAAEVVDGQQRITTLTILFCVLRELAEQDRRNEIDEYVHEPGRRSAGIKGHYRLRVWENDREFFQNNIQDKGKLSDFLDEGLLLDLPDRRQRMYENASHLMKKLKVLDKEKLNILLAFLVQRCYLVVVSTSDQGSAYRIFSVLNDRGLDLSPTDILKADVIGAINDVEVRSQYTEEWNEIEASLGRNDFRSLFTHIRMIYRKDKMRTRGTLQQEFRDGVLKQVNGSLDQAKATDFINNVLSPYSDAYMTVTRATYKSISGADKVNLYLKHLGRLDNSDWVPPVMEFFKNNSNNTVKITRFIQDLERLAYGMFIRRADINQRILRYARVLHVIQEGGELFEDGPLQLSIGEKTEIIQALEGPVYSLPRVPRPLLLRLDNLMASKGATYANEIISIEHVLPQHPLEGSEWFEWFPDEEVRKQWTHKLANLVLLSRRKNSRANNREFKYKKHAYFMREDVTPFAITTQVVSEDEWTPKVLERRQKSLIDALKKEWRLD